MKKWMRKTLALLLIVGMLLQPAVASFSAEAGEAKSGLPQVYLTVTDESTTGAALTKEMGYVAATVQIVDPKGQYSEILDAESLIKIRGNSTSEGAKKPFNVKLSSKQDVLGMGKGKKWCLLANMYDKSLMRNQLVYDFARQIGMPYTPDCQMVDLWLDGTYMGTYLLCEPIEANPTRVDIHVDNGDYLLEFERERVEDGVTYIKTKRYGMRFSMQEPETLTPEQNSDLLSRLSAVEDAIASGSVEKMAAVMDLASFVDLYLVEEFFKNVDCNMSSVKFYLKDGKLYAGPVWDYDLSSGNCSSSYYGSYNNRGGSGLSYEGFYANNSIWYRYLLKNEAFMNMVKQRYVELEPVIENLFRDNKLGKNRIDTVLDACAESFRANWTVWNVAKADSILERTPDKTFEANVAYLRNWLESRNNWMIRTYGLEEVLAGQDKFVHELDTYETYRNDADLQATYSRNTNGGPNSTVLVAANNPDNPGSTAMQFTYTLTSAGYSGVYRSVNGYWPGLEAVALWFKGDGRGQDILLQLSDGASYEAHLNAYSGFDPKSTDWQYLEIPIGNFTPKTGSGTINLKGIVSFAVYVNAVNGTQLTDSVLMLDDVKLIFPEEPAMPKITFNTTEMTASGNDNLITTLRKHISVTGGGELVQVQYTTDDSGILDAVNTLVPKGIFRTEGTVQVTIRKAQVYIDDTTYVLDVNQPITIRVENLAKPVDVVDYMLEITGKNLITGMHFDGNYSDPDSIHERVANEFGTYPALYSADFLTGSTVPQRQNMINEVIRQWQNGAIVQIMFHISPPQFTVSQERQGTWGGDGWNERRNQPNHIYSFLYNADWEALMTEGTELNTNWKLRMDEYAAFLQQLEDAGVTVLLRPFHEMNQHVFWWGGRPGLEGTAGLYRMFHDYMEKEKGLTNIIWVWDVQDMPENYGNALDPKFAPYRAGDIDQSTVIADYDAQDIDLFNPGADYYDILAVDFYDQGLNAPGDTLDHNHVYTQKWYERACAVAARDGKPMIIGETWAMITPETFAQQPNWTMCMPWGNRTWTHNATGAEGMKEHYQAFLNIEDTPTFATRVNEPVKECPSKDFVDVPGEDSWSHEGIDFCVRNGYMQGVSDTRFSPNGTLTRAQLVTILYRIAGSPEAAYTGVFTDVADGKWYTAAVEWAAANNVVYGTGNGRFSPNSLLTREQLAAILYRYSGSPEVSDSLADFADSAAVGKYAKDAMAWAVETGIIQGIRTGDLLNLSPKGNTTRAQAAVIIMRYLTAS